MRNLSHDILSYLLFGTIVHPNLLMHETRRVGLRTSFLRLYDKPLASKEGSGRVANSRIVYNLFSGRQGMYVAMITKSGPSFSDIVKSQPVEKARAPNPSTVPTM